MDWIGTLNVCNYAIGCVITGNKLWVCSYNCHDSLELVYFKYGILVVDHILQSRCQPNLFTYK